MSIHKICSLFLLFVHFFSACGMNNKTAFMKLCDEDIEAAVLYIRTQLIANQNNQELSLTEKSFIFGKLYASNPSGFSFVHGEKMLIREIAVFVKVNADEEKEDGIDHIAPNSAKEIKMNLKKMVKTAVGLIYGDAIELRKIKRL